MLECQCSADSDENDVILSFKFMGGTEPLWYPALPWGRTSIYQEHSMYHERSIFQNNHEWYTLIFTCQQFISCTVGNRNFLNIQRMNERTNELTNQPTNLPNNNPLTNQPTNQPNKQTNKWLVMRMKTCGIIISSSIGLWRDARQDDLVYSMLIRPLLLVLL